VVLKTISTLLGHSTISLPANTYVGVIPALAEDAMSRLGTLAGSLQFGSFVSRGSVGL
jgi:hypothetical protein